MLKKLHFYEKKHCGSPKGLIFLFRKSEKFGVEEWSERSNFQRYQT